VPGLPDGGFVVLQALGGILGESLHWDQSFWIDFFTLIIRLAGIRGVGISNSDVE
jgi:hypothetical protein